MPGNIASKPVGWAPIDNEEHDEKKFKKWLNDTGKAGADGTGGIDNDPRTRRAFAGAAVISPDGEEVALFLSESTRKADGAKGRAHST